MSSYDPFEVFGNDDDSDDNNNDKEEECEINTNIVKQQQEDDVTTHNKQKQLPVVFSSSTIKMTDTTNNNETVVVENNNETGEIASSSCTDNDNDDVFNVNDVIDIQNKLNLKWDKPLYVANESILFISSFHNKVGGNRGVIAKEDLQPGTLVLIEEPLVIWDQQQQYNNNNDDEFLLLLNILHNNILIHPNVNKILHCLELFHPTKVCVDHIFDSFDTTTATCTTTADNNMMINNNKTIIVRRRTQQQSDQSTIYSTNDQEQIINIIEDYENRYQNNNKYDEIFQIINEKIEKEKLYNSNHTIMTRLDIYRILLSLRYNGLQSGIYLYSALLNHSDQYNCVKFLPKITNHNNHNANYSEIRTTRYIPKGTSLTISYIPNILCHTSRRNYLWKQHRFDIGIDMTIHNNHDVLLQQMELIHNIFPIFPISSLIYLPTIEDDNDTMIITKRIEHTIDEMKQMYNDYSTTTKKKNSTNNIQMIQALELSVYELCMESSKQLQNDTHILLIPCRQLHLDVCYLLLQNDDGSNNNFINITIPILQRMIITSQILIQLQEILLGVDHYDLARTYLDLAQSIDTLLTKSPNSLLTSIIQTETSTIIQSPLRTTTEWMSLEHKARQQYNRIQKLYPNDAEQYIT